MRAPILAALALSAGCGSQSTVELTVDAAPKLGQVASLQVTVDLASGAKSQPASFPLAGSPSIPPAQTLLLLFDADHSGDAVFTVQALGGGPLATGTAAGTIVPGQLTMIAVSLGGAPPGDGGADLAGRDAAPPRDLIGADLAGADLSVPPDLAMPDLAVAPGCADGVKNGQETDVDCGGGSCPACAPGKTCNQPSDCDSGVCTSSQCAAPTCTDGVTNGNESDVDCGGGCAGCATGKQCNNNSDCTPGACIGAACASAFAAGVSYAAGSQPNGIAAGDLNGDGYPDVVVANSLGSNIGIHLGNGDGTLKPADFASTQAQPISLRLGDLNHDNKLDAVVTRFTQSGDVLLGKGDGTFVTHQPFPTLDTYDAQLVDLDGDTFLDLAYGVHSSGAVAIQRANGVGGFAAPVTANGFLYPDAIAVGDFDGDGAPDLAVAASNVDNALVFLNDGTGKVTYFAGANVGATPLGIAVGDWNGDKMDDLATANANGNSFSIMIGMGNGGVMPPVTLAGAGSSPRQLVSGDYNGDGYADLAAAAAGGPVLAFGRGDGTFDPPVVLPGAFALYLTQADLNGDGKPDLICAAANDDKLWVYLNVAP